MKMLFIFTKRDNFKITVCAPCGKAPMQKTKEPKKSLHYLKVCLYGI